MTSSSPQLIQSISSKLNNSNPNSSLQLNNPDTNHNHPPTNESNLPRKPSLTSTDHPFITQSANTSSNGSSFHTTKRTTPSIALNSSSPSPSSPNSLGFSKSSFQTFGRIGDPSQPPSPGLFNHPNSHLKKPFHHQLSNHSNQQQQQQQHNSFPPAQPNPSIRPRKLGSFNSLASNLVNPTSNQTNHRSAVINNNQKEQVHFKLTRDEPKSSEGELDEENGRDPLDARPKDSLTIQHKLKSKWVFWVLHRAPSKKISEEEFGKAMRRLGSCDTVESFYSLYLHIKRPSNLQPISDIHIFIDPIKPAWEDPMNVQGGKWTIRLKKGLANRLWETLIFSLIGGGLEKLITNSSSDDESDQHLNQCVDKDHREICGAVLSIRRDEDILAVWHKTGSPEASGDGKMAKQVKLSLQTVLQLPLNCLLSYKLNADCLSSTGVLNLTTTTQSSYNQLHHPHHSPNHNHNPSHHQHYQQQQNKLSGQDQYSAHHHPYNSNIKGNLNRNTTFNSSSNKNQHNLSSTNNLNLHNEPKIGINLTSNHLQFHNQAPSIHPGFGNLGSGPANNSNLQKK